MCACSRQGFRWWMSAISIACIQCIAHARTPSQLSDVWIALEVRLRPHEWTRCGLNANHLTECTCMLQFFVFLASDHVDQRAVHESGDATAVDERPPRAHHASFIFLDMHQKFNGMHDAEFQVHDSRGLQNSQARSSGAGANPAPLAMVLVRAAPVGGVTLDRAH